MIPLAVSNAPLADVFSGWLSYSLGGTPAWAWLALPVVGSLAWLAARLIGSLGTSLAKQREGAAKKSKLRSLVGFARKPAQWCVGTALFHLGRKPLPLSESLQGFLHYLELAVGTVALLWLLLRLTEMSSNFLGKQLDKTGRAHAKAAIPLIRSVVKGAVIIFGIVFLLQNLGINVGAILAGLGIGGLALALAGKRTVEDLFAGVTLVVDQPARVGDFCKFGSNSGTIEDIGIRSTRVRTADRTLVTIPNAKLCELPIENVAMRDRILLKTVIALSYDTNPAQMRSILASITSLLAERKEIAPGNRVRFIEFTESALNLEVFAYVVTRDFNEFLKVREEIYLGIMDIVAGSGSGFASPTPPVVLREGETLTVGEGRPATESKAPEQG
ncbi:mechanosensitive ion channel family protein [Luteolibacter flavescens]|uniref:Mechanosensitive ion channel family protein n=1 Tax=Luteolibacter flavescens TaxID=1859460 RepID=A0ABT3FUS5_9BACT|nr:mechanosensitive ion channel family protein [Luteolibacter flavescens]MCW1887345.1 mechanosensitive ion channel family protein [Luteolibacter flavescens]